jgi:lysozyme
MKRAWPWLIAVAVLAVGLYYADLLRLNFPSETRFPIRGIDVSHHQRQIGWFEVSLHDVKFAYIKATEGTDFKDPRFVYNWTQCPLDQIVPGAYHFYNFCKPGRAQALNFLSVLPVAVHRSSATVLPPALDLEFSGSCRRAPSQVEFKREITAFVKTLSTRYSGPPVFYVTEEIYKRYLEGHRQEYPPHLLWIRDVVKQPRLQPCREWTFWQYAATGKIPGAPGPTDLNVFCGTREEFEFLIRPGGSS